MVLNKEVFPRYRSNIYPDNILTIESEYHYNLGDELRLCGPGRSFIVRVIEVSVTMGRRSYTVIIDRELDWFRDAVQNVLG